MPGQSLSDSKLDETQAGRRATRQKAKGKGKGKAAAPCDVSDSSLLPWQRRGCGERFQREAAVAASCLRG